MHEHRIHSQNIGQGLLVLLVATSLIATASIAWTASRGLVGRMGTAQPWVWSPPANSDGQALTYSPAKALADVTPEGLAETFTDRVFWIVLALVVLGSIVLMADFPETS